MTASNSLGKSSPNSLPKKTGYINRDKALAFSLPDVAIKRSFYFFQYLFSTKNNLELISEYGIVP